MSEPFDDRDLLGTDRGAHTGTDRATARLGQTPVSKAFAGVPSDGLAHPGLAHQALPHHGHHAQAGSPGDQQFVYLRSQPILDRSGALNAYELLFRDSAQNHARVSDDAQATAQVVARTIGAIGVPAVLGQHRGYINIGRRLLFDDIVHLMSPQRFVLEILETVTVDA